MNVTVAAGSGRIDMVIGVDVSGSVRRERLPQALEFIASVVDDLEVSAVKTRVALVYFSDNAYQLFDVGQFNSKQDIMYWIKRTPYLGGRTNSAAALRLMVINHSTSCHTYHAKFSCVTSLLQTSL